MYFRLGLAGNVKGGFRWYGGRGTGRGRRIVGDTFLHVFHKLCQPRTESAGQQRYPGNVVHSLALLHEIGKVAGTELLRRLGQYNRLWNERVFVDVGRHTTRVLVVRNERRNTDTVRNEPETATWIT